MDHQSQQLTPESNALPMEEVKEGEMGEERKEIVMIPVENDPVAATDDSQFLQIQPQMMNKLQKIEESKLHAPASSHKSSTVTQGHSALQEERMDEAMIKRQFVHKLKKWQREKEQLKMRKQQIQLKKARQKEEMRLQKERQQEEEREFLRMQKQKQLQQKIQQIEERRMKRGQSLKNTNIQHSFHKVPSYTDQQIKYKEQEREEIQINIKLLKNKKSLSKLDPQQLKLHQKAYIQRIKQRLNIIPKQKHQKAKSDFNLYLRRNDQKKQAEMMKIIKMKKYQQKINQIPIKISEHKKEEKLIEIDKIKNPQKYRLLANKLLNDQQIYEEFKDFQLNINRKQIGINYLKELKENHEKATAKAKRSNSQLIRNNPQEKLPRISKKYQQTVKTVLRGQTKTRSVELPPSQSYKLSLDRSKERDSRYMKVLKQKLQQAIDL